MNGEQLKKLLDQQQNAYAQQMKILLEQNAQSSKDLKEQAAQQAKAFQEQAALQTQSVMEMFTKAIATLTTTTTVTSPDMQHQVVVERKPVDLASIINSLNNRVPIFKYCPEEDETFERWYTRYKEIITLDGQDMDEKTMCRFVLSKLEEREADQFRAHILPLEPSAVKFEDTIKILNKLFNRVKSLTRRRFELLAHQGTASDLADYTAKSRKLFAATEWNSLTTDQVECLIWVNGLTGADATEIRIRALRALEEKPDLKVPELVEKIIAAQSIRADAEFVGGKEKVVMAVQPEKENWRNRDSRKKPAHGPSSKQERQNSISEMKSCSKCGETEAKHNCRVRPDTVCHNCNKKGHYAKACRSPKRVEHNAVYISQIAVKALADEKPDDSHETIREVDKDDQAENKAVLASTGNDGHNRVYHEVMVNDTPITMLFDTGAEVTLISKKDWIKVGQPALSAPDVDLRAANGSGIEVQGRFKCEFILMGTKGEGECYVTSTGESTAGLSFITQVDQVYAPIKKWSVRAVQISDPKQLDSVSRKLERKLQKKFEDTLSPGLGRCTRVKGDLQLKQEAKPSFRNENGVLTPTNAIEAEVVAETFGQLRQLPITSAIIREETKKDETLAVVLESLRTGKWPKHGKATQLAVFYSRRNDLSITDDIVMFGRRVVVPMSLQSQVIRTLHKHHQGIERTKQLAREFVYYPHIDKDIEGIVRGCVACQEAAKTPTKVLLEPWPKANAPFERIHIDYCGPINSINYLVVVDAYSKWPEILPTRIISSEATIELLKPIFARFGNPKLIVSDNGRQFASDEFFKFCKGRGIKHLFSPPYHPQLNGQAERFVDTFKRALQKMEKEETTQEALQSFLFSYRATPCDSAPGQMSPAENFLGRPIRTLLDLLHPDDSKRPSDDPATGRSMKDQVDRHHGVKQRQFQPGEVVYVKDYRKAEPEWIVGKIMKRFGKVKYLVCCQGYYWYRHANQLRQSQSAQSKSTALLDMFDLEPPQTETVPSQNQDDPNTNTRASDAQTPFGSSTGPPPNPMPSAPRAQNPRNTVPARQAAPAVNPQWRTSTRTTSRGIPSVPLRQSTRQVRAPRRLVRDPTQKPYIGSTRLGRREML